MVSVSATASRFIHAIISTSPVSCCWAIAGTKPLASKHSVSSTAAIVVASLIMDAILRSHPQGAPDGVFTPDRNIAASRGPDLRGERRPPDRFAARSTGSDPGCRGSDRSLRPAGPPSPHPPRRRAAHGVPRAGLPAGARAGAQAGEHVVLCWMRQPWRYRPRGAVSDLPDVRPGHRTRRSRTGACTGGRGEASGLYRGQGDDRGGGTLREVRTGVGAHGDGCAPCCSGRFPRRADIV